MINMLNTGNFQTSYRNLDFHGSLIHFISGSIIHFHSTSRINLRSAAIRGNSFRLIILQVNNLCGTKSQCITIVHPGFHQCWTSYSIESHLTCIISSDCFIISLSPSRQSNMDVPVLRLNRDTIHTILLRRCIAHHSGHWGNHFHCNCSVTLKGIVRNLLLITTCCKC